MPSQVDAEDAIVYHVDKVRRPVAEDKALNKAIAMLQASCLPRARVQVMSLMAQS